MQLKMAYKMLVESIRRSLKLGLSVSDFTNVKII